MSVAKKGDRTVTQCSCHSTHLDSEGNQVDCSISQFEGIITSGSQNVLVEGAGVARVGDVVQEECSCCGGGSGVIANGSTTTKANSQFIARDGDEVTSHEGSTGHIQAVSSVRNTK